MLIQRRFFAAKFLMIQEDAPQERQGSASIV